MLAWPTMVQNLIGGLQGMVDHALVGHLVGYAGNAAIGVAIQIFIVVIVFVMSVFSGMGVLVSRFAGANEPEKVNRAVYQAFLAAIALWGLVLAPLGWVLAPWLLGLVHASPLVRAQALPFLRIMLRRQRRHAVLLHGERRVAGRGRRTDAVAPRHPAHGAEHRVQRGVHHAASDPCPAWAPPAPRSARRWRASS